LLEHLLEGVGNVLCQVETVGNLIGLRRPLIRSFGVRPGTISHDGRDAGVLPQPRRQRLCVAAVQQLDRAVGLQIDQERGIATTTAEGQVVYTQDARRGGLRRRHRVGQPQQRIVTRRSAGTVSESRPGTSAKCVAEVLEISAHVRGEATPVFQGRAEALREGLAPTRRIVATEPPDRDHEAHREAPPGQIAWRALVASMDAPGQLAARGAGRCVVGSFHIQEQGRAVEANARDQQRRQRGVFHRRASKTRPLSPALARLRALPTSRVRA
jgi:hypothetical protein